MQRFIGLLVCGVGLVGSTASADPVFPSKPISLVVAYGAGGLNDITARAVAKEMELTLGQPVVVVNRSGVGGVIGTRFVADSAPDGYTVGWGTSSQLVMNAGLYKRLPFNLETDIAMVGLATKTPLGFVVNGKYASLADFVDSARRNPGTLFYGSAGVGQVSHVLTEIFCKLVGIDVRHVPYRSSADMYTEVAAGRVDIILGTFSASSPSVRAGVTRDVAVGSDRRLPLRPDVPTFAEVGYPEYEPYTWSGLFVPSKTPPAIVQKLNAALNAALRSNELISASKKFGFLPLDPTPPEVAQKFVRNERTKWVPLIRTSGIEGD